MKLIDHTGWTNPYFKAAELLADDLSKENDKLRHNVESLIKKYQRKLSVVRKIDVLEREFFLDLCYKHYKKQVNNNVNYKINIKSLLLNLLHGLYKQEKNSIITIKSITNFKKEIKF